MKFVGISGYSTEVSVADLNAGHVVCVLFVCVQCSCVIAVEVSDCACTFENKAQVMNTAYVALLIKIMLNA